MSITVVKPRRGLTRATFGSDAASHRLRRVSALATVIVAALLAFAGAAQASIGGFSGGDGTEQGSGVNCTTLLDWSCLTSSQLVTTLDPSGAGDLAFAGTSSENNPDGWSFAPASSTSIPTKANS